ncbi:MAG: hypothetical protein PSN36_03180 [Gammaproteobacteria bacterium]|nr:hypothetical protein [Gammaproteobacteria bacterium]
MDINIINKLFVFWVIFYLTPGPVWLSVMEATRNLTFAEILRFFFRVFLTVNLSIQTSQAIICVVFVELISQLFSDIGMWFYLLGSAYTAYLSYKVFKSKRLNTNLNLTVYNLAIIMLLSPKIWLLFPSGAVIATQLNQGIIANSLIFAVIMLLVSNLLFVLYVFIGKVGTRLLKDNFAYLSCLLLVLFSAFLLLEGVNL